MRRFDARALAATSFGLYAISYFMRAGLTADAGFLAFVAPQLVQGFAMGLFFVTLLAVIFDGLPPHKIPAASGLSLLLSGASALGAASPRAASPPRSPPPYGTGAKRCTKHGSPIPSPCTRPPINNRSRNYTSSG